MLVESARGEYTDFRIPGMVVTSDGTLLRYCECRKGQSDWASIDLKVARSTDGGETWETVLWVMGEENTLNNPVMIADGGRVHFLYCKNYRELYYAVSDDDGVTFCDARRVCFEKSVDFFFSVVAVGPGHGIVHKGRLLVPIWFACNREDPKAHRPSRIATLYSEDGGNSWRVGESIFPEVLCNPSECALAVTGADEVLISIRHEGAEKRRGLAISADGISSWRDLRFPETLSDPVCMGSMTHDGKTVYHSNCDSEAGRVNLTVKCSEDEFRTFRARTVSDLGGYSDLALRNGKLCILYEKTVPSADGRRWGPFQLFFETPEL